MVRGTGFRGNLRIWFGEAEAVASEVVAVSPTVAQLTVPPGPAGAVDVTVQNGNDQSTRRTLPDGYVYDAFEVTIATAHQATGAALLALSVALLLWTGRLFRQEGVRGLGG